MMSYEIRRDNFMWILYNGHGHIELVYLPITVCKVEVIDVYNSMLPVVAFSIKL